MNPHSSYQYHLLLKEYRSLDVDHQENNFLRDLLIDSQITFTLIKLLFFKRMEREGKLICVYCQEPLKIYFGQKGDLPKDMVTLEHKTPISEGGLKYAQSNFLCACNKCNNKRDTKHIYKITETKYVW